MSDPELVISDYKELVKIKNEYICKLYNVLTEFSDPNNWDSNPPGSGRYWRGLGVPADIARNASEGKK